MEKLDVIRVGLSVDPGSASGGALACREDGSLGHGEVIHFSLPLDLPSAGGGVILFSSDSKH